MARFLSVPACLCLLLLSACTPRLQNLPGLSRPTTFAAGQSWLVQGRDGERLVSAEVATGRFGTYDMDRSDVPAGGEQASIRVRSNLTPVMTLRLLFPGSTPMIVQTVATGETDFLWNAGQAGAVYRCRVRAGEPGLDYLSGDFVRVEEGKEVPLGSCGVRRR
ncbi:hypothetical protein [Deinococcus sp. YIM 77859]|uniref:hypothetical protein n=1 Tax=Deinococcus sp. YIM 77859 TaxID=1540221 RepID=UPI000556E7B3|nr:hypothetical protein [Deinococcus sp. YIM 77859]